jgi:ApaG protein
MVTAVSSGIKISVVTHYEEEFSSAENQQFYFSYDIRIENINEYPVQLLRREWFITDSNGDKREVEGEGVVGEQPIIEPGSSYAYRSSCDFMTEIGTMHGSYLMKRLDAGLIFKARIPEFIMEVPFKLN